MEPSKKIYLLIAGLVLVVLIIFLVGSFGREALFPIEEEELAVSLCPEQISYQEDVYNIVEINGQCWMVENLKAFSYRDGTAIPKLTNSAEWAEDEQGAYTCYYNQASYCEDYGALYNWYVVNNEKRLCPEGWSVPTDEQWAKADNYGFEAIFGGFRNAAGPYSFLDERGFWWTSSSSGDFAFARVMNKDEQGIKRIESSKSSGFSVRCVKN